MVNKYSAQRTYSKVCGKIFDSKAEARHGELLYIREKAGDIRDLEYQVKFVLCAKPHITITVDFQYQDKQGVIHFVDYKGVMTREWRVKMAWLAEKHGIEIELVKGDR